jgi:hypothetical protein
MVPGRDAIEPGLTGNENDNSPPHVPYVRPRPTEWQRDEQGNWVSEAFDDTQWELICAQCGDTAGPIDEEEEGVRRLRGPYPTRHKAKHAANEHAKQWAPPTRWMPGSGFPDRF